jgi:hypothetical protein
MRYTVRKSIVRIVGTIWMPHVTCAQVRDLSDYDVGNIRDIAEFMGEEGITRKAVEYWLGGNAGDFSHVIDFEASIEDGDKTIDIPWASEDGEFAYIDAMSGSED